ncbi:MAG: glycosyltransferase [Terriglobales bacterium]|jgi:undecaprenyl-phosphate 4-deoxy-4-formamido-L-arabinose transferase
MNETETQEPESLLEVSVVVPVYQGEHTLETLAGEIAPLTLSQTTPAGRRFRVVEMLLVHDGAVDRSADVMRVLASQHPFLRIIWLSRNYGQHAATLAGMASTVAEWVVTLDEDGQQDPRDIGRMLDEALDHRVRLVYASPTNPAPHGLLRNRLSGLAKWISTRVLGSRLGAFNSFRLIEGEVARGVAAYCGANVYLDVALSWVIGTAGHCPVALRMEHGRRSGYTLRLLLRHFWQLVLTSGTLPLRFIALLGCASILFAVVMSAFETWRRLHDKIPVQGWTSMFIVTCLFGGLILVSLGIIAEYLGVAVSMAMGKPAYLIVSRPAEDLGLKR